MRNGKMLAMCAMAMLGIGGVQPYLHGEDLPRPGSLGVPNAGDESSATPRFGKPLASQPGDYLPDAGTAAPQPIATAAVSASRPLVTLSLSVPEPPVPTTKLAAAQTTQTDNDVELDAPTLEPLDRTRRRYSVRPWVAVEGGVWWVRGSSLPALVTASTPGTSGTNAGVLGLPSTTTLIGDQRVNSDARASGRFSFGAAADSSWGVEANLWLVDSLQSRRTVGSDGSQIIARPFTFAQTGASAAALVSFPGVLAGSATVAARSDPLYGAEVLLRGPLYDRCDRRVNFLAGYRFLHLSESLLIQENLTSLDPAALGANIVVADHFATSNAFHGGEVGLNAEWQRGSFSLSLLGKLAVGGLQRRVHIDGTTAATAAGTTVTFPGGLLALPSNIGNFSSDRCTVIPELGVTSAWQITPRLRATLGYSLLWWPMVVRPGDQIDLVVNANLLPPTVATGPARPAFVLRDSDLWLQGVHLGLEYRY